MNRLGWGALTATMLAAPCGHAQGAGPVIYAADRGSDALDGRTPGRAVRTIARARDLARRVTGPRAIEITGRFALAAPVRFEPPDSDLTVRAGRGGATVAGSGNVINAFILRGARNLTIQGISFCDFAQNTLIVYDGNGVTVRRVTIDDTRSRAWSQGAIHFTGSAQRVTVADNRISRSGFAGILFDTTQTSRVVQITITGNRVTDACMAVSDCGAIYINNRGRQIRDVRIVGNIVSRFGGVRDTRAIYLDDWASNTVVTGNQISGPGTYALQIHGGSNNRIASNAIDVRALRWGVLVQPGIGSSDRSMTGNVLSGNLFVGVADSAARLMVPRSVARDRYPSWRGNLLCVADVRGETRRCGVVTPRIDPGIVGAVVRSGLYTDGTDALDWLAGNP